MLTPVRAQWLRAAVALPFLVVAVVGAVLGAPAVWIPSLAGGIVAVFLLPHTLGPLVSMATRLRSRSGEGRRLQKRTRSIRACSYLDAAGVVTCALDSKGRIALINRRGLEILGLNEEAEVLGQEWASCFLPKDACAGARSKLAEAVAENGAHSDSCRDFSCLSAHGEERVLSWRCMPIPGGAGVLVSGVDVTDRRRKEREHQRLSTAMRMSEEGIVLMDLDGTITDINRAVLSLYRVDKPDRILGRNALEFIVPEDRARGELALAELIKTGTVGNREYRVRDHHGALHSIEMNVSIIRDEAGEPSGLVAILRDIGRRKREEDRLRLAAEVSSDLIYEWDPSTDELTWFGGIDETLGHEPGEVSCTIDGWISRIHPEDAERLREALERHRARGGRIHEEYRIQHRDGSWRHWLDRGSPVLDEQGVPRRWIGACVDLTSRVRGEEMLRKRALQLQMVSEVGRHLSSILDLERLLEYVVQAIQERFGFYHVDAFLLDGAHAVYRTGSSVEDDAYWKSIGLKYAVGREGLVGLAASTGEPLRVNDVSQHEAFLPDPRLSDTQSELVVPICREGQVLGVLDIHSRGIGAFDEDDKTVMVILCGQLAAAVQNARLYEAAQQEIDERCRAEEALRKSETRYRTLVEEIPLAVYDGDENWNPKSVTSRIEEITGYPSSAFMDGRVHWIDLIHVDDLARVCEDSEQLIRKGGESTQTYKIVRQDGSVAWVEETRSVIRDPERDMDCVHGIIKDVTARRSAEEEKRAMEGRLLQAQRLESIGTLASGIAHEINNPLTGIINYAQLIHDRIANADLAEFAEGIVHEGNRVAQIVQDLLAFSRQEKERHSPARIDDIIDATMSLVGAVLRNDQIRLVVRIQPGLSQVNCRSQQIQQVLLNLLTNARDALNERFPGYHIEKTLTVSVSSSQLREQPSVQIEVKDQGAGILPEQIDRIFDPFFTTKPRDRGTGLGLSISYGIVRDHRGTLVAESVPNAYTRFVVELPANSQWTFHGDEKGSEA